MEQVSLRFRDLAFTGAFVSCATFVMSVSLITVFNTGSLLFGGDIGERIYYFCILAWVLGFLVYAAIDKKIKTATVRQLLFFIAAGVCIFAFSNVAFAFLKSGYVILALLCLFLFGVLYAAVYHKTALRLNGSAYTGRVVGISIATVELAIWPVTSIIENATVTFVTVAAVLALILLYVRASAPAIPAENIKDGHESPAAQANQGRTILALALCAVLMGVMIGMTHEIYMVNIAEGVSKMNDWPRLLHAASMLGLGFVADIKKRRYLPLTTICIMMLFSVGIILWEKSFPLGIAMCVYYAFRATGIMFFTVSFLDIAPKTKSPGLTSVMGRLCHSPMEIVLFFVMTALKPGLLGIIGISLVSTVMLFLVMFWGRLFVQKAEPLPTAVLPGISIEEQAAGYGFTGREIEALILLLDGHTTGDIAERMNIREHTAQKYISSMMAKSYSESRAILITKFSGRKI